MIPDSVHLPNSILTPSAYAPRPPGLPGVVPLVGSVISIQNNCSCLNSFRSVLSPEPFPCQMLQLKLQSWTLCFAVGPYLNEITLGPMDF